MRLARAIGIVLLSVSPCLAGSYTLNTTAVQDTVLQRIAQERGQTPMQVIREQVVDLLRGWIASFPQRKVGIDRETWKKLNGPTRAAICADLTVAAADCPDPAEEP